MGLIRSELRPRHGGPAMARDGFEQRCVGGSGDGDAGSTAAAATE